MVEVIKLARDSIKANKSKIFKEAWNKMISVLINLKLNEKQKEFISPNKKKSFASAFNEIIRYGNKTFTFIETTCLIKWKLHPDALEDMIPNFSRMDRINYLRLSVLHITDMRHLEKHDRDTWSYFMEEKFFKAKTTAGSKMEQLVSGQSSNSSTSNR